MCQVKKVLKPQNITYINRSFYEDTHFFFHVYYIKCISKGNIIKSIIKFKYLQPFKKKISELLKDN